MVNLTGGTLDFISPSLRAGFAQSPIKKLLHFVLYGCNRIVRGSSWRDALMTVGAKTILKLTAAAESIVTTPDWYPIE